MYQSKGYDVEPRGGLRPDGGIDLIVRKGHLHWIVQCKHYRDELNVGGQKLIRSGRRDLLPPHNRPTTVTIAALMVGVGRPLRGGS